jgi:O-antigen/teichoic acid export membrane protein
MDESAKVEVIISRKKATLWNFLFLNIGFLITIFNGMLIIPLYLHYINASVYGAWLATGNILTWITIIDPGVAGVILQRVSYHIGENNKDEIGLAITSGIVVSTGLFFIALLVGYGLSFFIVDVAKIDKLYSKDILGAFRIAMWGTAFSLLADTFRNIILAYQKTKLHGIMLYSILIAGIVLNVVLLVFHMGVYALAYTSFFRGILTLGFAVFYAVVLINRNGIKLKFDFQYFRSFSKVFAFTFSSSLFETVANNIDLIIVSRYLGPQSVAILDLSRRPVRMVSGLANNITISMLPSLPHLFGSGDKIKIKSTIIRIWNFILWISGFIMGGFILFNYSFIKNWIGSQFWVGNTNNMVICVSILLWVIGYSLSNITLSMGDMKNNSIVTIIRSILYILALFVFVKIMGMTGVIVAFFIPAVVMVCYYPRKLYEFVQLKDSGKKLLKEVNFILVFLLLCSVIAYFLLIKLHWFGLIAGCILYAIIFLFLLFTVSSPFKSELRNIINLLKSKLNFN